MKAYTLPSHRTGKWEEGKKLETASQVLSPALLAQVPQGNKNGTHTV